MKTIKSLTLCLLLLVTLDACKKRIIHTDGDLETPLFVASAAQAEENRGVSWLLQMCSEKSDCSAIKTTYRNASVLNAGWMYLTSNPNRCKCASEFYSDPRPKRVRIHICNSTCFPERGRQCQPYECFGGMNTAQANKAVLNNDQAVYKRIDKAIAQARQDLSAAKGQTEVAVSFCLECSLDPQARQKGNNYVRSKFQDIPNIRFVDNPLTGQCFPGYLCERHGTPASGANGISDNDGADYDGIDQLKYWRQNQKAYLALAWKSCNNGLKRGEGFIPPLDRANYCTLGRDMPDFNSFAQTNAIAENTPQNPADRKGCKTMYKAPDGPGGLILKLGDGRNYGVLLTPAGLSKKMFKRVELRKDGKVVDGSKPGVGFRYGVPYEHDPANRKRRVYDLRRHPNTYPDNSVLFADGNCWVLKKPRFRID